MKSRRISLLVTAIDGQNACHSTSGLILESTSNPGILLVPLEDPETEKPRPSHYILYKVDTDKALKCGTAKLHFTLKSPIRYFSHRMYKGWHLVNESFKLEIYVHQSGAKNHSLFKEMVKTNVHYRLDALLKFMPKKSGAVIKPKTNHEEAVWVIGAPSWEAQWSEQPHTSQDLVTAGVPYLLARSRKVQRQLDERA